MKDNPPGAKLVPEYAERFADLLPTIKKSGPDGVDDYAQVKEVSIEALNVMQRRIADAPIIIADNIAAYLYETDQEGKRWETLAACMPPYSSLWLEWRRPGQSEALTKMGYRPEVYGLYTGAHVTTLPIQTIFDPNSEHGPAFEMMRYESAKMHNVVEKAKWVVCLQFATTSPDASEACYIGSAFLFLDRNGQHVTSPTTFAPPGAPKQFKYAFDDMLAVASYTLCFMNCKNVVQHDVEPSQTSQKRRRKQWKDALVKYKVLEIDPGGETRNRGESAPTGAHNALHICRGNFAHYTEDAKLFGKFVGSFWRPPHKKGRASHGTMVKDYSIKKPEPTAAA